MRGTRGARFDRFGCNRVGRGVGNLTFNVICMTQATSFDTALTDGFPNELLEKGMLCSITDIIGVSR